MIAAYSMKLYYFGKLFMYFPELFTKICCLKSLFMSGPQSEAVFSTCGNHEKLYKGKTFELSSEGCVEVQQVAGM